DPNKTVPSPANSSMSNVSSGSILPPAPFPTPAPRPPSLVTSTTLEILAAASASSYENFCELVQKRLTTFNYLKKAHEGKIHWFSTICLTKKDLASQYDNAKMKKRTHNFFILGVSLAPILDITNPQDYVKALNTLLQEFEYYSNEHSKAKMKMFFRKSKVKQDDDTSFQESGEFTYLYVPNISFDLDYFQAFYTLCDMLVEVYNKLLTGTSDIWIQPFTDSVLKIDGKFKVWSKIISSITKELDGLARNLIKNELQSTDPMIIMSGLVTVPSRGSISAQGSTSSMISSDSNPNSVSGVY
ncbi:9567_t:CDS:2, partial [Paraglomus brasilianum]